VAAVSKHALAGAIEQLRRHPLLPSGETTGVTDGRHAERSKYAPAHAKAETFDLRVRSRNHTVFVRGIPIVAGGASLNWQ
jgi:hypothetical protein